MVFIVKNIRKFTIFSFFCAIFLMNILISYKSHAFIARSTTFDDREICEESRGIWREFGNSCGDKCLSKFDKFAMCSWKINHACDCGKARCWDGKTCVKMLEYEEFYNEKMAKEEEQLKEARQKRQLQLLLNNKKIMEKILRESNSGNSQQNQNSNNKNLAPQSNLQEIQEKVKSQSKLNDKNIIGETNENKILQNSSGKILIKQKENDGVNKATPLFEKLLENQDSKNKEQDSKRPSPVLGPIGLPEIPLPQ
jgi:hypothetical protein